MFSSARGAEHLVGKVFWCGLSFSPPLLSRAAHTQPCLHGTYFPLLYFEILASVIDGELITVAGHDCSEEVRSLQLLKQREPKANYILGEGKGLL